MGKGWLIFLAPTGNPRRDAELVAEGDARGARAPHVLDLERAAQPKVVYMTSKGALNAAESLAKENPGRQVFLCETITVVETTEPTVITKQFNATGELLPIE